MAQSGLRGGAIYLGVPTIRSLIYALLPAGATTVIAVHCSAVVQDMHRPPVRLRAYHRCMLVRCCHVLRHCCMCWCALLVHCCTAALRHAARASDAGAAAVCSAEWGPTSLSCSPQQQQLLAMHEAKQGQSVLPTQLPLLPYYPAAMYT